MPKACPLEAVGGPCKYSVGFIHSDHHVFTRRLDNPSALYHSYHDVVSIDPSTAWASLVAQTVKNLPAMQETWVWSVCQEYLLEKGMATHSSILTWRIPWTEEPGRLPSMGLQEVRHNWVTNIFTPFIVKKYWLYSSCCTIYPCRLFYT